MATVLHPVEGDAVKALTGFIFGRIRRPRSVKRKSVVRIEFAPPDPLACFITKFRVSDLQGRTLLCDTGLREYVVMQRTDDWWVWRMRNYNGTPQWSERVFITASGAIEDLYYLFIERKDAES